MKPMILYVLSLLLGTCLGWLLPVRSMSMIGLTLQGFLVSSVLRLCCISRSAYLKASLAAGAGLLLAAADGTDLMRLLAAAAGTLGFSLLYEQLTDPGWRHTSLRWALILAAVVFILVSRTPGHLLSLLVLGLIVLLMQQSPGSMQKKATELGSALSERERREHLESIRAMMKLPEISRKTAAGKSSGQRMKLPDKTGRIAEK